MTRESDEDFAMDVTDGSILEKRAEDRTVQMEMYERWRCMRDEEIVSYRVVQSGHNDSRQIQFMTQIRSNRAIK
jgi:hypothetical protein